jgi:hypothetical protein
MRTCLITNVSTMYKPLQEYGKIWWLRHFISHRMSHCKDSAMMRTCLVGAKGIFVEQRWRKQKPVLHWHLYMVKSEITLLVSWILSPKETREMDVDGRDLGREYVLLNAGTHHLLNQVKWNDLVQNLSLPKNQQRFFDSRLVGQNALKVLHFS